MNFEKPEYEITEYDQNKNYGKFVIKPLERVLKQFDTSKM